MIELTKRQRDLIYNLTKGGSYKTASDLSAKLQLSEKTVRNCIKEINYLFEEPKFITSVKSKGFKLNKKNKHYNYIFSQEYVYNESSFKRQVLILRKIIEKPKMSVYDLCDELYISENRLKKDIDNLNRQIKNRNSSLVIERKNNAYCMNGSEEDYRNIITFFLVNEIKEFNFEIENYQEYFNEIDIREVKIVVLKYFKTQDIAMHDLDIFSLLLHILIMIDRILEGKYIHSLLEPQHLAPNTEQLYSDLEKLIGMKFPRSEEIYLETLLSSKMHAFDNDLPYDTYRTFVDKIIEEIMKNYHIDLHNDQEFMKGLCFHLQSLCNRLEHHQFFKNPLIQDLKLQFPLIYDISVFIAMMIQDSYGLTLYEDEIGYITLHLMVAVEKLQYFDKKKVAIVNPGGKASDSFLASKLLSRLGDKIEIVGYYSLFEVESLDRSNVDLIITTAIIVKDLGIKVENCSIAVTDSDIKRIEDRLKEITIKKQNNQKEQLFYKSLFFPTCKFSTKKEVIDFLGEELYKQGFCDLDYLEYVNKREEIAPSSFGNLFAIPHPIKRTAKKNALAVCTLKNSILWNHNEVKVVLMFSACGDENDIFQEVYNSIVGMLADANKVIKLSKTTDFVDFVEEFYRDI